MATAKDCHILTSYYKKKYKEHYKVPPIVNDNTARWGFDNVLKGMSPDETKELIDYWFDLSSPQRHRLDWFFYNYEKLIEIKMAQAEDKASRERLKKESLERARKWRESGHKGITGN